MTDAKQNPVASYERKRLKQGIPEKRQSVIQKVEAKNPLVRQFGVTSFNADNYHQMIVKDQDPEQLKRTLQQLKDGAKNIQTEIGHFLFENYQCFLETKDSLKKLHNTFLDVETSVVSCYPALLQAIQSNLESEVSEAQIHAKSEQLKEKEDADYDLKLRWEIEETLEKIQVLISSCNFDEAFESLQKDLKKANKIKNRVTKMEIDEQIDITRLQLEEEIKRKIQFNAKPSLVKFSYTELGLCKAEIIEIYLSSQTQQLKQILHRLVPLSLKRPHALQVAGLMQRAVKQVQIQEQQQFQADSVKQLDQLASMVKVFTQSLITLSENFKKIFQNEEMRLGLWLMHVGEVIFGEQLGLYMLDWHTLGSIKEALNVVIMQCMYQLKRQNINLQLKVERTIAPPLLKSLNSLLQQVLECGLDHDVEQQGIKKYQKQTQQPQLIQYIYDGSTLRSLGNQATPTDHTVLLDSTRARYFQLILDFQNNFGFKIQDSSYDYISLQLRTSMAMMVASQCLIPDSKYFNEIVGEPEKELVQLAYTAHLCSLIKPKIKLAPAIQQRVNKDHESAFNKFKTKFDKLVRKILVTNIEQQLLKEQATKQLMKNYFMPQVMTEFLPAPTIKSLLQKCKEMSGKLMTDLVRSWFAQVVIDILGDLFLGQKEDLMMRHQEIASQIDRIHQLQINAKFCQPSGQQQLVLGVWMVGKVLQVSEFEIKKTVTKIVETGRCDWYNEQSCIELINQFFN